MTQPRYLYTELPSLIQARINCGERQYDAYTGKYSVISLARTGRESDSIVNVEQKTEWFDKHTERIEQARGYSYLAYTCNSAVPSQWHGRCLAVQRMGGRD